MVDPTAPRLSTRLLVRHAAELLLARAERWKAVLPRERLAGIVFAVVLGETIARQPFRDPASGRWIGIDAASESQRSIGAAAIAHSMRIPDTTARRRMAELIDAGLLIRNGSRVSVAASFCDDPRLPEICAKNLDHLARSLSALEQAGYEPARAARDAADTVPAEVVERLFLTLELRVMETFTELYSDLISGTIIAATVAANVRHITEDPVLARRYADEDALPPDEERRPISLRALARAIDLPFETVRRRAGDLGEKGLLVTRDAGVVVPSALLQTESHVRNNRRIVLYFEQMLTALVALVGVERPA